MFMFDDFNKFLIENQAEYVNILNSFLGGDNKKDGITRPFDLVNELFSVGCFFGSSFNFFDLVEIVAIAAAFAFAIEIIVAAAVAIVVAAAVAIEIVAAIKEGELDAELLANDNCNSGNRCENGKNDEDLLNDLPCACSFVFNSYKFVLKHDIFTSEYYINCFL